MAFPGANVMTCFAHAIGGSHGKSKISNKSESEEKIRTQSADPQKKNGGARPKTGSAQVWR